MSKRNVFSEVGGLHPRRSVFDLSYEKKLTCDMAQLIPVMCDEVVPGDVFKIGNQAVVRFQPLVAPILHEINMYVHYFFVPYRILGMTITPTFSEMSELFRLYGIKMHNASRPLS